MVLKVLPFSIEKVWKMVLKMCGDPEEIILRYLLLFQLIIAEFMFFSRYTVKKWIRLRSYAVLGLLHHTAALGKFGKQHRA